MLDLQERQSTLDLARQCVGQGLSIVPVAHGTNYPSVAWKAYQIRLPSQDELTEWFSGPDQPRGLGVVCGKVSGNLVCLCFSTPDAYDHFAENPAHRGLLETAPIAFSARQTYVFFRSPNLMPSTAMYIGGYEGKAGEVRSDGKFVMLPPTFDPDGNECEWQRPLGPIIPVQRPDKLALTGKPPRMSRGDTKSVVTI